MGTNRFTQYQFDSPALYAALDAHRQVQGLSWQQVATRIGVATSTLARTKKGGPMETDGILAMVRWLGCAPERFVVKNEPVTPSRTWIGSGPFACEPTLHGTTRFNTKALYAAMDAHRRRQKMTWRDIAREVGKVSPGMLTRLSKGGRVDVNVMVAAVGYLGQTIASFTRKVQRM